MRRLGARVILCWAAASGAACDGSKPVTALPRPATPPPLESADACSSAWRPVTSPQDSFAISAPPTVPTSQLVYQGGTLYYVNKANDLLALPTDGSAPATLASLPTPSTELWIEGTNLLFAQGTLQNQIYSLPITGGTPQLLLDGGAYRAHPGGARLHAFNATDFYWLEGTTVWHQSRAGGVANQIGQFQLQDYSPSHLGLTANAVLTGAEWLDPRYPAMPVETGADAFPFDGTGRSALSIPYSPPTDLAPFVAGVDSSGVYWSIPSTAEHLSALILSPADHGAARAVWPSLPLASANFRNVWPNPDGGWVLVGEQQFSDGAKRITLTFVDPQGAVTLLGCGPTDDESVDGSVAVAPDAVYLSTQNQRTFTWEIDRVAR